MNSVLHYVRQELSGLVGHMFHPAMISLFFVVVNQRILKTGTIHHSTFNLEQMKGVLETVATLANLIKLWWKRMNTRHNSRDSCPEQRTARKHFTQGSRISIFLAIASVIKEELKTSYIIMRQQSVQLLALFNMTTKMAILLLKSDSFQTKIDDRVPRDQE